jgi:hypothetical protein
VTLRDRLERLEVRAREPGEAAPPKMSRAMERFLHLHEYASREIAGPEPLPDLPYTQEDREDDGRCLAEVIPQYRMSPGYQRGEGKAFLDHWEQETRETSERSTVSKYTQEDHAKYRERVEEEERKRKEASAKKQQRRAFPAAGGKPEDFEAEYRAQQTESVRQTMKRREEEARAQQRTISAI